MLNIREELSEALRAALAGQADDLLEQARWEMPKDAGLGDLACPIAFQLAARKRMPPPAAAKDLAAALTEKIAGSPLREAIDRVEAVHGFVNVHLSQLALARVLEHILREGERYGRSAAGAAQKVLIELVSANPTGPLSVAHGRQAATGDALGNVLAAAGYTVT